MFDENFMTLATIGAFAIQEHPSSSGNAFLSNRGIFEDKVVNRSAALLALWTSVPILLIFKRVKSLFGLVLRSSGWRGDYD